MMSWNNWWNSGNYQHNQPCTSSPSQPPSSPPPSSSGSSNPDPDYSDDNTIYSENAGDVPIGGGGSQVAQTGGGASQVAQTGTGTGHNFNVTNNTGKTQYFAFSAGSNPQAGYSNNVLAVMELKPGETGTFEAGGNVPGIRISTSGPNGETNMNQVLFEDTILLDPMGSGKVVHNPDVSAVAGTVGYDGQPEYITISDGTRTIGHGTTTGIYDYDIEDTDPNRATNPMNMALDPATSYDIVFS